LGDIGEEGRVHLFIMGRTSLSHVMEQGSWTTIINGRISNGGGCDLYKQSQRGRSMADELSYLCGKLKLTEEEVMWRSPKEGVISVWLGTL
jgi:hypothetical protein